MKKLFLSFDKGMNFIVGKILQSYKQPVNLLLPFDMLSSYRRFIIMKYQFDFVKSCFYASAVILLMILRKVAYFALLWCSGLASV